MPQYPGRKFDATLVTTSNAMNANSRSMLVELQADNASGELSAGAYCQVDFQLPSDPSMLAAGDGLGNQQQAAPKSQSSVPTAGGAKAVSSVAISATVSRSPPGSRVRSG